MQQRKDGEPAMPTKRQPIATAPKDGTKVRIFGLTLGEHPWTAIASYMVNGWRNEHNLGLSSYPYAPLEWEPLQ